MAITRDRMDVYVTIIDELRYKDKFRYMNKTIEGVHASIQRHMDFFTVGIVTVDHESIERNLTQMRDIYRSGVIFTLHSGERDFEIHCKFDCLLE